MNLLQKPLLSCVYYPQDIVVDGCSLNEDSGYLQQVLLSAFKIIRACFKNIIYYSRTP